MFKLDRIIDSLPDSILLHIFSFLDGPFLTTAACVSQRWRDVAYDDSLYKSLVHDVFNVDVKKGVAKGKDNWRSEYKRLFYHVPNILSEKLTNHTDEVLHVSFAHNGSLFSTTSKDCTIKVWEVGYPTKLKYDFNFAEKFHWNFTQFSCFNSNDTKLLVSSVKSGDIDRRGYVAILSIKKDFELIKIVCMDPSQLFGAWLNMETFLGGSLDINLDGGALVTVNIEAFNVESSLESIHPEYLNLESLDFFEAQQDAKVLFTFCSETASLIKFLTVVKNTSLPNSVLNSDTEKLLPKVNCDNDKNVADDWRNSTCTCQPDEASEKYLVTKEDNSNDLCASASNSSPSDKCDSLLIYVTGEFAIALHQVGVKLIPKDILTKPQMVDNSGDGHVVMHVSNQEIRIRPVWKPDYSDQMIDLNGHVTGLCLSKDNRYLYVNCRPWVGTIDREDPWNTPILSQEIEIRVIDLYDLSDTGQRYTGHKGLSPSTMCCFIFLNTSDDYVGSGSENCQAYLWDKHYSSLLSTYPHGSGVVNGVAFNPVDQEYYVTVSDDHTIQIWRSKHHMSLLRKIT